MSTKMKGRSVPSLSRSSSSTSTSFASVPFVIFPTMLLLTELSSSWSSSSPLFVNGETGAHIAGYEATVSAHSLRPQLELESFQLQIKQNLKGYNFELASSIFGKHFALTTSRHTEHNTAARSSSSSSLSSSLITINKSSYNNTVGDTAFEVCRTKNRRKKTKSNAVVPGPADVLLLTGGSNGGWGGSPSSSCPFPEFEAHVEYYGRLDYGDEWISAALDGRPTTTVVNTNQKADDQLSIGDQDDQEEEDDDSQQLKGRENFALLNADGRAAAVRTATLTMQSLVMMYRWMTEEAIEVCRRHCSHGMEYKTAGLHDTICAEATANWDRAVAIFVGQIEGSNRGGNGNGHMLYSLMRRYEIEFGTKKQRVRQKIMDLFLEGQDYLWESDCRQASTRSNKIMKLLNVVLVQGVLKSAWLLHNHNNLASSNDDDDGIVDSYWGEGAAYSASLLPLLYVCSREDAKYLDSTMKVAHKDAVEDGTLNITRLDTSHIDYEQVVRTLEKNYGCLGISSSIVGIYQGGVPLGTESLPSSSSLLSLSPSSSSSSLRSTPKTKYAGTSTVVGEDGSSEFLSIAGICVLMVILCIVSRRNQRSKNGINKGDSNDSVARQAQRRQYHLEREPFRSGFLDGGMVELTAPSPQRTNADERFLDEDDLSDGLSDDSLDLEEEEMRRIHRANAPIANTGHISAAAGMRRRSTHSSHSSYMTMDDSFDSMEASFQD